MPKVKKNNKSKAEKSENPRELHSGAYYTRLQMLISIFAKNPYLLLSKKNKDLVDHIKTVPGFDELTVRSLEFYIRDARQLWNERNQAKLDNEINKAIIQLDSIVESAMNLLEYQSAIRAIKERAIIQGYYKEQVQSDININVSRRTITKPNK